MESHCCHVVHGMALKIYLTIVFFQRRMTADGYFTSEIGIKDLQYMGNTFVAEWKGCPDEVLKKLGVSAGV